MFLDCGWKPGDWTLNLGAVTANCANHCTSVSIWFTSSFKKKRKKVHEPWDKQPIRGLQEELQVAHLFHLMLLPNSEPFGNKMIRRIFFHTLLSWKQPSPPLKKKKKNCCILFGVVDVVQRYSPLCCSSELFLLSEGQTWATPASGTLLTTTQGWSGHLAYQASSQWAVDPMWASPARSARFSLFCF